MNRLPTFTIIAVLSAVFSAAVFGAALFANTNTHQLAKPQNTTPIRQIPENTPKTPISSRGQLLYENHCTVCHNSSVHIREHRKVRSVADIKKWVFRWSQHLKLNWSHAEINDVTEHLNQRFYQFPDEKTDAH